MTRRRKILWSITAIALVIPLIAWGSWYFTTPETVRFFGPFAAVRCEVVEDFPPDYVMRLKARCSREKFERFIQFKGMKPMPPDDARVLPTGPPWWNPPSNSRATHQLIHNRYQIFAKYEDGYLYYLFYDF